MAKKRKHNPEQPELPIEGVVPANGGKAKPAATPHGNGDAKSKPGKSRNGETHVLAESVAVPVVPHHVFKPGNIELPFHRRVDRSFLDYASYVIRDRAISNLFDGVKTVQRRLFWAF